MPPFVFSLLNMRGRLRRPLNFRDMVGRKGSEKMPDKELDKKWYWLGYACGANTRKEIKEMPTKITNLGDRGVQLVPTETQRVSFFIGMLCGRGKLVQNFNVVQLIQYQDKKAKKKGDYLTLGMTEVKGEQGSSVNMPLIISNNSVDNRGYIGFQAKISYPTTYLTLTDLIQANPNLTTLQYQHDAVNGIVLIQGLMDEVSYSDAVQVYLKFAISNNCPTSQTITVCGPTGTGQGSDILTLISGEPYYIQPITLENGLIKLPDQQGQYTPTQPFSATIPAIGDNYTYIGEQSSLTYDFDMSLSYGGSISGGGSGGSGANLAVQVTFADGSSQIYYIPVTEGLNHYNGKIPMTLPSMKQGPIIITIWVEPEDEDDLYYWFIKAGALWGFEIEIARDEVGEYEETQVDKPKMVFEYLVISDDYILIYEGYSPVVSDIVVGDGLVIVDSENHSTYHEWVIIAEDILELFDDCISEELFPDIPITDWVVEDKFMLSDFVNSQTFKEWVYKVIEHTLLCDGVVLDGPQIDFRNVTFSEIMQILDGYTKQQYTEHNSGGGDSLSLGDGYILEFD